MPYKRKEDKQAQQKQWSKNNAAHKQEYMKQYYLDNCTTIKTKVAIYQNANKDKIHNNHLKRLYGISFSIKVEMFYQQLGCCAICKSDIKSIRSAHIDHNHTTGNIRGLLCHYCNTMLGQARDNSDILRKAANYLDTYQQNKEQ